MGQPLPVLLERLEQAVGPSGERRDSYTSTSPQAQHIADRLPLVHRTASDTPGARDWRQIFEHSTLKAEPVPTDHERRAGRATSVYFFLGAGAYPSGQIALLLEPAEVLRYVTEASFTPYDTGGMCYCTPDWDSDRRFRHLTDYTGNAKEVGSFAGPYLAAHFRDPRGYVRAAQKSVPDFPCFHALVGDGDRRAWTIEIQAHEDVTITSEAPLLRQLLVVGTHKLLELPDEYIARAHVLPDSSPENIIYKEIASTIEAGLA
jgi:hypothetical protein